MPDRPDTATVTTADGVVLHLADLKPWEEREPDLATGIDGSPILAGLARGWGLTAHVERATWPAQAVLTGGTATVEFADGTTCKAVVHLPGPDNGQRVVELNGIGRPPWR